MQHHYQSSRLATRTRLLLLAALLGGASLPAGAQALNYFAVNAQVANTTYTDLGTTGTAITTANTDDANSAAQPLGFTFAYGGASYSQFVLNTNGYLKLGNAGPVAPYFSNGAQDSGGGPLNSADTNLLLPFNTDLEAGASPTEYRVATTGAVGSRITTIQWKNVSDKARAASQSNATVVPKQYTSLNFQVRLYEGSNNVEFVYGTATGASSTTMTSVVAVGLKGNGTEATQLTTVTKNNFQWGTATIQDGGYETAPAGFTISSGAPPAVGRTYRFDAALPSDVALTALYTIEQQPVNQGYVHQAVLTNKGAAPQTNLVVTLSFSGANTTTLTGTVAALAPGRRALVTFPEVKLSNPGTSTLTATLPADDDVANNVQTASTLNQAETLGTDIIFSYIKPGSVSTNGSGFTSSSTPVTNAFCAAYTTSKPFQFTMVRAFIANSATAVGERIYGLLADKNGNILGQSAPYIIQASDLNTLHTFMLPTPLTVPAGTYLAGMAHTVSATQTFPMGLQAEAPLRPNTFYTLPISTPGAPIAAAASSNGRYMVEAGGRVMVLATASPALAQALTVFPNPSVTGQFSLAIRGANAPAGLAVTVINQLGQAVYTGTARDNATTSLDLSQLAAGLYRVQLRHGSSFASQPLSIVR